MSRYTKYSNYPNVVDQKLPAPVSIKNDIMLAPNHEAIHANSAKQPYTLLVDSRDRNIELYSNPNNYVITIPRYKDVLSFELVSADVPHTGYNIDAQSNQLYLATSEDMFERYYVGSRVAGSSYIVATIPPGYYEASDLVSTIVAADTAGSVNYQFYYEAAPQGYIWNTGVVAQAMHIAVPSINFAIAFNKKTLKYVIIGDAPFSILTRDMDHNNRINQQNLYQNGVYTPNSLLNTGIYGDSNFRPLPNGIYQILGLEMKNYHPYYNNYDYVPSYPSGGTNTLLDSAFDSFSGGTVASAVGKNYFYPSPSEPFNPTAPFANPGSEPTGLGGVAGTYVVYSAPNRADLTGEKYIILSITELNYRDGTNDVLENYFCRILLDTPLNITPVGSNITTMSSVQTVKFIKASDIGNNRCIRYFTPTMGVMSKLSIRWLKHDGTPYDFQGNDHTLTFEVQTIKQSGTYFN
jgi:hypothetical protein